MGNTVMAAGFTMEIGNCPPGYSRPAPMYDCRPNVSGQTYLQQDLMTRGAYYQDDDGSTKGGGGMQSTGAPTQDFYTAQSPIGMQMPTVQSGGGDNTMLLLLGAVALVLVMKK